MCYTLSVSRNSFLLNIASCLLLYTYSARYPDGKILSLFFAYVGLMQLFDWIFWENQEKNNVNFIFTKIAMIVNHTQPLLLGGLILLFKGKIQDLGLLLLVMYTILSLIYTVSSFNDIDYTLVKLEDGKKSLYWQWNFKYNNGYVYALFVLVLGILAYQNLNSPMNVLFTIVNFITFYLAHDKNTSIGRIWCNYASLVPVVFFLFGTSKQ